MLRSNIQEKLWVEYIYIYNYYGDYDDENHIYTI
jgi:hypothetical protein